VLSVEIVMVEGGEEKVRDVLLESAVKLHDQGTLVVIVSLRSYPELVSMAVETAFEDVCARHLF
jgi:hypothetical protein